MSPGSGSAESGNTPSAPPRGNDDIWQDLTHKCALGAIYDSHERYPHPRCFPGTRSRLLSTLGQRVDQDDRKIIWLKGESGSGKSAVAHTFAEQLRAAGVLAATFFFSRQYAARNSTGRFLPTVAYQLGLHHADAREAVVRAVADDPALLSAEKSRQEQLDKLVLEPLRRLVPHWKGKSMCLVLDDVDEAETTEPSQIQPLVLLLAQLIRDPNVPIAHIVLTSRASPQVEAALTHDTTAGVVRTILIEEFDADADVARFLRASLGDIYDSRGLAFVGPKPWPPEGDLLRLARRAGGSFVFASTVLRLIDQERPRDRLALVLGMLDDDDVTGRAGGVRGVDGLYRFVLSARQCVPWEKAAEVLRDVVVGLADPLSAYDLHVLFEADLRPWLLPLSTVLCVPPATSKARVRTYHSSVHDFLASPERARELHADPAVVHRRLFRACFQLMARKLKRDVCALRDASRAQGDLPGFAQKRDAAITPALRYACRYWVHHLQRARPDEEVQRLLGEFLQTRVLYWIEVFALTGELHVAGRCLAAASKVILDWRFYMQQEISLMLLHDAQRLIQDFAPALRFSALHVYATALPLSPAKSQLRQVYGDALALAGAAPVRVEEGLHDEWDCVKRTIDTGVPCSAVSLSADGARVAAASRRGVDVYDIGTGRLVASRRGGGEMCRVRYAYSNDLIAVSDGRGAWYVWDVSTGSFARLEGQVDGGGLAFDGAVDACAFSRDDASVACAYAFEGGTSNVIYVWAVANPLYPTLRIAHAGADSVQALQFTHAGERIMSATRGGVRLFDARSGELLWDDAVPACARWDGAVWHAFAPHDDFTVHVDPEAGRMCYSRLKGPFSARRLRVRSLVGGEQQQQPPSSPRKKLFGWMKRGDAAKTVGQEAPFDVRPLFVGDALVAVRLASTVYTPYRQASATSPSWRVSARHAPGDAAIQVLDLSLARSTPARDPTLVFMLPAQPLAPFVALFRADYARNAGEIRVYTAHAPPTVLAVPVTNTTGLSVSPDMSVYAYVQGNRTCIVSVATGRRLCRISPAPERRENRPLGDYHHVFSPRSSYLATAVDGQVKVWRTASGALVDAVTVPALQPDAIAFASGESRVAWIRSARSGGPEADVFEIAGSPQRLRRLASFGFGRWEPSRPVVACQLAFPSGGDDGGGGGVRCLLHDGASLAVYEWADAAPGPVRVAFASVPAERGGGASVGSVWASPDLERVYYTTLSRRSYALSLDTGTIPEEGAEDGRVVVRSYEPDPEHGPDVLFDARSWSDIGISRDGWLSKGGRRLCWLPPRYRPRLPSSDGFAGVSEPVQFQAVGNKVIILADNRPLVLRVVDSDVRYYQTTLSAGGSADIVRSVPQAPLRRETTHFSLLSGRSMSHRRFRST